MFPIVAPAALYIPAPKASLPEGAVILFDIKLLSILSIVLVLYIAPPCLLLVELFDAI